MILARELSINMTEQEINTFVFVLVNRWRCVKSGLPNNTQSNNALFESSYFLFAPLIFFQIKHQMKMLP